MTFFPDDFTLFAIGSFRVPSYVVAVLVGLVISLLILTKENKKHGYRKIDTLELFIVCMITGFLFSRLFWVLGNLAEYMRYTPYIFLVTDGGYDATGGLIGVALGTWLYTRGHHMSWRRALDMTAPLTLLLITIARVGRVMREDTLWFVIALDFLGFIIIWFEIHRYREGRRRGETAATTFMWFGLVTFLTNIMKWDMRSTHDVIMAGLCVVIALIGYIYLHTHPLDRPVILFDLDGTLMDSRRMVLLCFGYFFKKYSNIRNFTIDKQRKVFIQPLRTSFKEFFPEQDDEKLAEEYRTYQASFSWSNDVTLFPHTEQVLHELWEDGYKLGIVSSRLTESCDSWLRQFRLTYFDVVIGRDQYKRGKPSSEGILYACQRLKQGHDNCIYIGDSKSDIEAAKNAGCYAIGFYPKRNDPTADERDKLKLGELEAAKPNAIIGDLTELLDILKETHGWTYEKM
ncbi:MAG: HAD-IA family hydrolase [Erysipelotrichaceae bacterium]|nr:HAD-IA family hydrolase [Erysipelotrichaceae bacterium]MDY6035469.1 HAD-IA family hydrolase [Bulleidia sp.]